MLRRVRWSEKVGRLIVGARVSIAFVHTQSLFGRRCFEQCKDKSSVLKQPRMKCYTVAMEQASKDSTAPNQGSLFHLSLYIYLYCECVVDSFSLY
ncbi:hypothetical protein HanRHA438_Chr16g0770641 [Helianthus annuus]|nr:hypothetical protein HanRHA438_Chr16g0770641 [Helianthus annuus]